jgi:hypothetical protein
MARRVEFVSVASVVEPLLVPIGIPVIKREIVRAPGAVSIRVRPLRHAAVSRHGAISSAVGSIPSALPAPFPTEHGVTGAAAAECGPASSGGFGGFASALGRCVERLDDQQKCGYHPQHA